MSRSRSHSFRGWAFLLALPFGLLAACGGSGAGAPVLDDGGGPGGAPLAPGSDASLAALLTSAGVFAPGFDPATTSYTVGPALLPASTTLRATTTDPAATLRVNGVPAPSGADVGPLPLLAGITPLTIEVTAADGATRRTYTVVCQRALTVEEARVRVTDPSGGAFGISVALSGDTLAVGGYGDFFGGAVYVFVRAGPAWTQQARLQASNRRAGDQFGAVLALDADTLAVGAPGEASAGSGVNPGPVAEADSSAPAAGAAYVFRRLGTAWAQEAYVKASNPDANDQFGSAVALSGGTLVVGATQESSAATGVNPGSSAEADDSLPGSGAAYVYVRVGSTWVQQAFLKASNADGADLFGRSVAVSGDTVAVGAIGEDSAATGVNAGGGASSDDSAGQSGAVYVFSRSGATWTQQAYLKASNTDAGDVFGYALALSGETLAVGASQEASAAKGVLSGPPAVEDDTAPQAGAVYVFVRSGTAWTQEAYLKPLDTAAGDHFGHALDLEGDVLACGAPNEDSFALGINPSPALQDNNGATDSGVAYVFLRSGATWVQDAYVKGSATGTGDSLGAAVAVGGARIAVVTASEQHDSGSGVCYVAR